MQKAKLDLSKSNVYHIKKMCIMSAIGFAYWPIKAITFVVNIASLHNYLGCV